jgi:hypothetical protein
MNSCLSLGSAQLGGGFLYLPVSNLCCDRGLSDDVAEDRHSDLHTFGVMCKHLYLHRIN